MFIVSCSTVQEEGMGLGEKKQGKVKSYFSVNSSSSWPSFSLLNLITEHRRRGPSWQVESTA